MPVSWGQVDGFRELLLQEEFGDARAWEAHFPKSLLGNHDPKTQHPVLSAEGANAGTSH